MHSAGDGVAVFCDPPFKEEEALGQGRIGFLFKYPIMSQNIHPATLKKNY